MISAVTGQGVRELVGRLAALVHEAREAEPVVEGIVMLRPEPKGALVERVGDGEFRLVGRDVERIVALNDVTTPEALSFIDHHMTGSACRGCSPAPAPAKATSCGSASSASSTNRTSDAHRRQDRHLVADGQLGVIERGAIAKLSDELVARARRRATRCSWSRRERSPPVSRRSG